MAKYNGQTVTVSQFTGVDEKGPSTDVVTITFEDGSSQQVALGAIGELTADDKLEVSKIEEPPPPEPLP